MAMRERKLLAEIDRVLKKVDDGLVLFEGLWEMTHEAVQSNQRDKYKAELQKEMKKLQRLRDQIKHWISDSAVKDKSRLLVARRRIEEKMEAHKAFEKESKTKAYSKQALAQAATRVDPEEEAKNDIRAWLQSCIEELTVQRGVLEVEAEGLSTRRGGSRDPERSDEIKDMLERYTFHEQKFEEILRALENNHVSVDEIEDVRESVDYFIASNQDPDFYEDEYLYDDLNLDNVSVDVRVNTTSTANPEPSQSSNRKKTKSKSIKTPVVEEPIEDLLFGSPPPRKNKQKTKSKSVTGKTTAKRGISKSDKRGSKNEVKSGYAAKAAANVPKTDVSKMSFKSAAAAAASPPRQNSNRQGGNNNGNSGNNSGNSGNSGNNNSSRNANSSGNGNNGNGATQGRPSTNNDRRSAPDADGKNNSASAAANNSNNNNQGSGTGGNSNNSNNNNSANNNNNNSSQGNRKGNNNRGNNNNNNNNNNNAGNNVGNGNSSNSSAQPRYNQPQTLAELAAASLRNTPGGDAAAAAAAASMGPQRRAQAATLAALDSSFRNLPVASDSLRNAGFQPKDPMNTPSFYPDTPHPVFRNPAVFSKFETEALFFIFYNQQGTYQQYHAARELKKQSWRFHKNYLTWFQRHEEPLAITDEYEHGTYVYFDYETSWCKRKKTEFTFEYRFLEDDPLV